MRVVLGAIVLVAVSACSSGGTPETTPHQPKQMTSASSSPLDAQERWARATHQLRQLSTGHFSAVSSDGVVSTPAETEGGVFDIQRGSMDVEMAVRTGSGGQDVTRTRLTADDKGYLTMLSWSGRWANCWLPLNSTALQSQLAGEERLPVPVAVLLHVEVADPDQAGAEIRGQLDAFSALRLQGYSAVTLRDLKSRLLRTRVPITVSVDDDPVVVTARLEGADIEKALRRAGTQLSGGTDIRRVHTEVEITQVGEPVDIKPPDPDALLPNGATKSDRCAASGR
jgi:hypothetical protein